MRDRDRLRSLVISLENVHDFAALRGDARRALPDTVTMREGVGAVSLIGAGINQDFGNWRRAAAILAELGCPMLGASTSSFRISFLIPQEHVEPAVRALHDGLVTEGRSDPPPTEHQRLQQFEGHPPPHRPVYTVHAATRGLEERQHMRTRLVVIGGAFAVLAAAATPAAPTREAA